MFHQKRNFSHQQPLSTSSTQAALSAATHALTMSQPPTGSLSSAAAATAMRTLSPPPPPIGNIQTKRMVRRQASLSQANARSKSSQAPLRRSSSSSSMSSKTFRDQPPGRSSSSRGQAKILQLPEIPAKFSRGKVVGRRSHSAGAVMRPSLNGPKLSPNAMRDTGIEGKPEVSHLANQAPYLTTVPEYEMYEGSVNKGHGSIGSDAMNSSPSRVPATNCNTFSIPFLAERSRTASQPVVESLQRGSQGPYAEEGSCHSTTQCSSGYLLVPVDATAQKLNLEIDNMHADRSELNAIQPFETDSWIIAEATIEPSRYPLHSTSITAHEAGGGEGCTRTNSPAKGLGQKAMPRQILNDSPSKFAEYQDYVNNNLPCSESFGMVGALELQAEGCFPSELESRNLRVSMHQSKDTPTYTRFSSHGSTEDIQRIRRLASRSASPVKPALKQQHTRSTLPDGKLGAASQPGHAVSETSDGTSTGSDDGLKSGHRKKLNRVSFDDETEIVSIAPSPPTSPEGVLPGSPAARLGTKARRAGTRKKRTYEADSFDDYEFGDVLKPRPILPFFGSIRRNRRAEGRKLSIASLSDNESVTTTDYDEIMIGCSLSDNDDLAGPFLHSRLKAGQPQAHTNSGDDHYPVNSERHTFSRERDRASKADNFQFFNIDDRTSPGPDTTFDTCLNLYFPCTEKQVSVSIEEGMHSTELLHIPGSFPRHSIGQEQRASEDEMSEYTPNNTTLGEENKQEKGNGDMEDESDESIYDDAAERLDDNSSGSINGIISNELYGSMKSNTVANGSRFASSASVTKPDGCTVHTMEEKDSRSDLDFSLSPQYSLPPLPPPKSKLRVSGSVMIPQRQVMPLAPCGGHDSGTGVDDTSQQPMERHVARSQIFSKERCGRTASPDTVSSTYEDTGGCELRERAGGVHLPTSGAINAGLPIASEVAMKVPDCRAREFKSNSPPAIRQTLRRDLQTFRRQPKSKVHSSPGRVRRLRPTLSGSTPGRMPMTLRRENQDGRAPLPSRGSPSKRTPKAEGLHKSGHTNSESLAARGGRQDSLALYAESSDDEDLVMHSLPPVRGIPRRHNMYDGDSTELEDSSEDERQPQYHARTRRPAQTMTKPGLAAVARSRGVTVEELEELLRQQPRVQKPGLFRWLGVRKSRCEDSDPCRASLDRSDKWNTTPEESQKACGQVHAKLTNNNYGGEGTVHSQSVSKADKKGLKMYKMANNWSSNSKNERSVIAGQAAEPHARKNSPVYRAEATAAGKAYANLCQDNAGSEATGPGTIAEVDGDLPQVAPGDAPALDIMIPQAGRKKRFPSLRKMLGFRSSAL